METPTHLRIVKAAGSRNGVGMGQLIKWKEWSDEAFECADREGKLLLLDLTATWCHWCHVMDETTYSDLEVARTINESFVPVRVDIDQRPDISERYNRGGFPTTAFLSARGESVWGATYIPPAEMKRVMQSILKAQRSGEIHQALERARTSTLETARPRLDQGVPSEDEIKHLFEGLFDSYDVEHGGFGTEPKFPHPDAVDLLIAKSLSEGDSVLSEAVMHTLANMAGGLYDDVEGGVFRYSVVRDWSVPHFEKMLETNLGYLRNLARAHAAFGEVRLRELAEGVASYLLNTLRDDGTGAFFGSQDADEQYYKLSSQARAKRAAPSVDRTVYSGLNALASAVFIEAGTLLGRSDLVDAGLKALDRIMNTQWSRDKGLIRHSEGQDLYLSEDQVELVGALIAAMEVRRTSELGPVALRSVDCTRKGFAHPEGGLGDIAIDEEGIGALAKPMRSLVTNAKWAHRLSLLGMALGKTELVDEARTILGSFDLELVRAHGVFSASYVTASTALRAGPIKVEVHGVLERPEENALWLASKTAMEPRAVTLFVRDQDDFSVVCTERGCSSKIASPDELVRMLRGTAQGQD